MDLLSAFADELDALARAGRAIRLGDRDFERTFERFDELLGGMRSLANRMRAGAPSLPGSANDHGVWQGPTCVITGHAQILHSVVHRPARARNPGSAA